MRYGAQRQHRPPVKGFAPDRVVFLGQAKVEFALPGIELLARDFQEHCEFLVGVGGPEALDDFVASVHAASELDRGRARRGLHFSG